MSGHELLKHEKTISSKSNKTFIHTQAPYEEENSNQFPQIPSCPYWGQIMTLPYYTSWAIPILSSRIQQQEDNTPSLRPQAGQLCPAHWGQIFFSMSGSFSPDFSCHYCLLSASLSGFLSFLVQTQLVFPVALTTPSFQWAPDVLTWNHSVSSSFSLFKSQCLYHCYVIVLTLGGVWGGWTMTFSKQRRRLLFILSIKA